MKKEDGIIVIRTMVPLYPSKYSKTSQDPLERILCKLKKAFIARRGLTITHLVNRPRLADSIANEITIQFLISNFNGDLSSERIEDIRKEYSEAALQVLEPYIEYLVQKDPGEELNLLALEDAEGYAISQIDDLVKETPELAKLRQESERARIENENRKVAFSERHLAKLGIPYQAQADPVYALLADGLKPKKHNARYMQNVLSEIGRMAQAAKSSSKSPL